MSDDSGKATDPSSAIRPRLGLAIASLVLGILAFVLSLFLIGGILGVIGLALGVVHIRRTGGSRAMAWWGVGLSIAAILASVGLGILYYQAYKKVVAAMNSESGGATGADVEQWEGVLAPNITVTTLDGQTIELGKLRGKRVVLDFWATWCPPCVRESPHFVQLFNETSRDQLVVVGISSESESTLRAFVKKQGINYSIASASDLPSPYKDVQSIPTTFFIDRKGIIQTIAVGYHDFAAIKEHALADNVKAEPKPPPSPAASELKQSSQPLTPVGIWTNSISGATALATGDWDGDGAAEILVAAGKRLHVLSAAGAEKTTVPLPERFTLIEAGRDATRGVRLLGYSNWGRKVAVMDASGREIWSYPCSSGIDGAHWDDLDGDGTDEMVVGMNGWGGLHAVSADGKKIWAVTDIGNVWNQAVIPAAKERAALIFATEAGGTVRVYDSKGKLQRTLRPLGKYCTQLAAKVVNRDGIIQCVAIGDGRVIAFDEHGQVAWSTPSAQSNTGWRKTTFAAGDVDGDGEIEWAFHEASGDLVIANWRGEKLASIPNQSRLEDFTIAPESEHGLLVTLRDSNLVAYRFNPGGNR